MSTLCVCLLGEFRVRSGKQDLTGLYPRKLQELFCYLLLYRDRSHQREALAAQLWCDSSTSQSKKNLRQALWQLQNTTDAAGSYPNRHLLATDSYYVRVDPDADFWLDVATLEQAFERAQGTAGRGLDAPRVDALRQAITLYHGDLLEGWFQDWCLYERERLQNMYLASLDKLMDYCEVSGQYEAGLAYGARTLRCDEARERTHRRLMRLHYLAGDRTAAMRQFEYCIEALRRELAVGPASRTVALYEQIRSERLARPAPQRSPSSPVPDPPDLELSLQQLQSTLADAQGLLQQIRRAIEG
jgi:DNA-binding SARP family transcriptional activator